jgi:hypothetical protein
MTPESERRRFQFSLATLLVVQALVSLFLGIGKGLGWPVMISLVVVSTMFTLTVAGTVWIAGDWDRSTHLARVAAKVIALIALAMLAVAALGWLAF